MWVVDFNRQSLDRVVPGIRIQQWTAQFEAAGWHVVTVKYGPRLSEVFTQPGGPDLHAWLDAMPNEQYQSLFGLSPVALRERFLHGAPTAVRDWCGELPDAELAGLVTDLGGHDFTALLRAYAACDAVTDRPSVVFAYTIKGWGLPIAVDPRNHSSLLSVEQVDRLRTGLGLTPETEWDRLDPMSPVGRWAARRSRHLERPPRPDQPVVTVPAQTGLRPSKQVSSQEAFGRVLSNLSRDRDVAPYLVTTAPDVATSTNLAGFVNRLDVFSPTDRPSWGRDTLLKWPEPRVDSTSSWASAK